MSLILPPPPLPRYCKNCIWSRKLDPHIDYAFTCHYAPPNRTGNYSGRYPWPEVEAKDFCSAFTSMPNPDFKS